MYTIMEIVHEALAPWVRNHGNRVIKELKTRMKAEETQRDKEEKITGQFASQRPDSNRQLGTYKVPALPLRHAGM